MIEDQQRRWEKFSTHLSVGLESIFRSQTYLTEEVGSSNPEQKWGEMHPHIGPYEAGISTEYCDTMGMRIEYSKWPKSKDYILVSLYAFLQV